MQLRPTKRSRSSPISWRWVSTTQPWATSPTS